MKKNWITPAVLAVCLAAPGAYFSVTAHAAPPSWAASGVQDRDDWDRPPDEYNDAQGQGFHEGVEAARRDYDQGRHKDADDHRIYKRPPVPHDLRDAFRDGFRHGYDMAKRHMNEHREDHPY